MFKGYKKSFLVINIVLLIVILVLAINLIIIKHSSYLFCILSTLIPFILLVINYGYENKKRRYTYELIFYIFSYCILFLLITYILGIFIGFTQNIYKLNFNNLIHNIMPYTILIISSELLRHEIIRKGDGSTLSYVFITILLIMIDMTLFLNTYNLNNGDEQIKYICSIMLPSVFKNIILMYFTKISGPIPSIIYRMILDLKIVVFPLFPDFGLYFDCTINCIIPVLICGIIEINLRKFKNKEIISNEMKNNFLYKHIILIVLIIIALGINLLSSGNFKYTMLAIGSESMTPTVCKGDAIIYKKIDKKKLPKIGDILVFKKEKKIVVHRIIEIVELSNNEKIYYTKGDNNEAPDGYPIEINEILGTVKLKIKYIGIPSVLIGEAIKK